VTNLDNKEDVELVTPDNRRVGNVQIETNVESKEKGPGFFESLGKSALKSTDIVPAAKFVKNAFTAPNYLDDEKPDGWTPVDYKNVSDLPVKYWNRVYNAHSPSELAVIRRDSFQEIADKKYLDSGSGIGNVLGNIVGGAFSMSSLIPIAGQLKYATVTKGFVNNAMRQLPGVTASAMMRNAILTSDDVSKDYVDWARDTFVEMAFASTIFGALGARAAGKVQTGKQFLRDKFDGVDFKTIAKEDGTFGGYRAEAMEGSSVGAAFVSKAQQHVDEGIAKYGESGLFKKIFSTSPIVKGLTSPFLSVKKWTNSMFTHNIITGGIERGAPKGPAAEEFAKFWTNQSIKIETDIAEAWAEHAGLRGPLKEARAKISNDTMLLSEFEEAMFDPMFNGGAVLDKSIPADTVAAIEKAAGVVREHYDELYNKLVELKILDPNRSSVTDLSYINRIYNKMKMQELGPQKWAEEVIPALKKQSDYIREVERPLTEATELKSKLRTDRKAIRDALKNTPVKNKAMRKGLEEIDKGLTLQVKQAIKREKAITRDIQTRIDNGEIGREYLEGSPYFTQSELKEINAIRAPITRERNTHIKKMKSAKNNLGQLEREYSVYNNKYNEGRKPGQKNKPKDETLLDLEEKIRLKKNEIDELRKLRKSFEAKTEESIYKIPKNEKNADMFTYNRKSGKYNVVNPKANPWLRHALDDEQISELSKAVYDTILQETPEQMVSRMGKSMMDGGTNPLKSRTLLLPTSVLKPFLETNVKRLMKTQTNYLGKVIGLETVMRRQDKSARDALESMLNDLKADHDINLVKAHSIPDEKLRKKAVKKENNAFSDARDFMETSYSIYWGDYSPGRLGGKTGQNIDSSLRTLKNWSISTMLGGLPFLQLGEGFANFMRHSFWPGIEDSLIPMLKSSTFRNMAKEQANDAGLALNVALNASSSELWGNGLHYQPKTGIERSAEWFAKFSGNITGANFLQDVNQTIAASMTASQIARNIIKVVEGKALPQKEIERMGLVGLTGQDLVPVYNQIKQFGKTYGKGEDVAHIANFGEWTDFKAAQVFKMAINKEVSSVILTPNMLDVPFAFKNQFLSSMTQFMSYSFAAQNSFLIPLLQRPDANKLIAIMGMTMMGATVGPLRQLAAGQEVDLKPKKLLWEGISNSGVLGVFADFANRLNAAFELPLLDDFKADRYRHKTALDLLGGPLGGILNNAQQVGNMFLSGQINESGLKKAKNLMPFANSWWLRYLGNKGIESLDLPETKADASKWFED
jgi:hypothetical protein